MASEFHKKAISRITPEERALMVKSLEIISQIHAILDGRRISQKRLSEMLNVSQPAVSKMLTPGANLELNTVIRLELILGETIITTPKSMTEIVESRFVELKTIPANKSDSSHLSVAYRAGEQSFAQILVN